MQHNCIKHKCIKHKCIKHNCIKHKCIKHKCIKHKCINLIWGNPSEPGWYLKPWIWHWNIDNQAPWINRQRWMTHWITDQSILSIPKRWARWSRRRWKTVQSNDGNPTGWLSRCLGLVAGAWQFLGNGRGSITDAHPWLIHQHPIAIGQCHGGAIYRDLDEPAALGGRVKSSPSNWVPRLSMKLRCGHAAGPNTVAFPPYRKCPIKRH